MFPHTNEITVEFMKGYSRLPLRLLKRIWFCFPAKTQNRNYFKEINRKGARFLPSITFLQQQRSLGVSEIDVFSKNKLLPTVIKNTIIFQTSYFEIVFVISTMFTHVIVKAISLKIYDVIM